MTTNPKYKRTNDVTNMLKEFATSNHPWAVKFREFATSATTK
jgi:hypothetical protein